MFKICVIGCGAMSTTGHGPSFRKYKADHPDTCLAGCCDLSEEKAQRYAQSFGFDAWYTDYPAMLDAIKPDAVALICPVALTKELSIDIMQRGYHIILEKPPGLNSDQIGQMLAVAKEKGVFVRTSFNRRYTPLILKLKELLAGKRIFNITYQMYRKARRDADFATTAIHAIDAVKYIAGSDYARVDFTYQELPEEGQNVANYQLSGRFENGVMAQIALVPMGGALFERIAVNTLNETYFVELPIKTSPDGNGRLRMFREGVCALDIPGQTLVDEAEMFQQCGFYEENRGFFEMIRSGTAPTCDLESGMQSVDIANCLRNRKQAYESNAL